MKRTDRFVMSHRPYAVDLSSWRRGEWETAHDGRQFASQEMTAIWFRRRGGETVAYLGTLWDSSGADSAAEFLRTLSTARHGGNWIAAWDGDSVWTESPATQTDLDRYAKVLDAALTGLLNDQSLPQGYDGWYTFR